MAIFLPSLDHLVEQFRTLPGIGRKTATRLAFSMLERSEESAEDFLQAITDARKNVKRCRICQNLSEQDICPICSDESRDHSVICVVEDVRSAAAFENVREFHGVYHVLHGVLSPASGIGPENLCIQELMDRLHPDQNGHRTVNEVILATNPTVEGESTAMYLSSLIEPLGIQVTRLACGMPVGSDLEYADAVTLCRALQGRHRIN